MTAPLDKLVTETKANTVVFAIQCAMGIAGDMASAYWSVCRGEAVPSVYFAQADSRIKQLQQCMEHLMQPEPSNKRRAK